MQALSNVIERIEKIANGNEDSTAIKCDLNLLNRLLGGGFSKGNLYVIAGKESSGKTSFIVSLISDITHNRADDLRVGVIALNTWENRFIARILSNVMGVLLESILRGKLQEEDRQKLKYAINLDDFKRIERAAPGYMNLEDLIATCEMWVSKKDVQIVFIDYLQLVSLKGVGDNDLKIFTVSKALKKLAIDLDMPIIVTVPVTSGKLFSDLKDLRKEGAIETFADVIIFINSQFHSTDDTQEYNQKVILSIQKNNTGLLDNIMIRAAVHVQKFVQFDYLN